ncbi:MAG: WbqC family protein [Planctomycetota bacterium]
MIAGAHQPHFLPWLGYLDKVRRSDVFVIVDHVQFERQNFQNRNRILGHAGPQWLVVPVRQRSRDERIVDKEIDDRRDGRTTWNEKLVLSLQHAYGRAPFFRPYFAELEALLLGPWSRLVDLDEALLRWFLDVFEIRARIVRSSTLPGIAGTKTQLIASMLGAVGATTYLSGAGGSRLYLDVDLLTARGIEVQWQTFEHPRYSQVHAPSSFVPKLAALDLVFNCGPASPAILRGEAAVEASAP